MKTVLLIPMLFAALAGTGFHAVAQSIAETARAGESRQGEIQASSHALVDELDAMIDEYKRNGLHGDDIKTFTSLRAVLTKVSEKDMARILVLLQQAGAQNDPATALKVIAEAYSQQKGVLTEMEQILASYASQEEALDLSNAVKDLADRQAANLQTGIESAQYSTSHEDQAPLVASIQGQAAEQKAIADEMAILQTKIANFARDPNNQELADRFNKGVAEAAQITPVLGSATDSMNQRKLFEAVLSEKNGRDQLRHLARTIAPPEDPADALQAALEQLDKIISQQKEVISATNSGMPGSIQDYLTSQLHANSDLFRWAQKNGLLNTPLDQVVTHKEVQDGYKGYAAYVGATNAPGIESQEGDLTNQTDSLVQDIQTLAKPAADALSAAITPPMQNARSSLADNDLGNAIKPENDALADMIAARDLLQQQLLDAEKADETTGDALSDLEGMQKETEALMHNQDALDRDTPVPKTPQQAAADAKQQAALETKAAQLSQQTADQAPAASQALSKAGTNMEQAASTIPNPTQAPQTQAQQANAMANLNQANEALKAQIAQMAQTEKQLEEAKKELEALEKLIEAEQKLQADTVQTMPQEQKERPVIQALAPRQLGIQNDTNAFAQTLTADPQQPNGATRMKTAASASAHMGDASAHLQQGEAAVANPDEQKALDDLYALRDDLAAQIQKQEAELSQPDSKADQAADDAAAAIATAQADLAQAQNAMNAAQDPAAAAELKPAQATMADATAQDTGLPPDAEGAMKAATAALANAEAQAEAGDSAKAQAAGQQAGAALAQAAAALAQAANGPATGAPPPGTPGAPTGPSTSSGPMKGHVPGKAFLGEGPAAISAGGGRIRGGAKVLRLPPQVRKALEESQSEKSPPQYAAKVEQYMENLSNDSSEQ